MTRRKIAQITFMLFAGAWAAGCQPLDHWSVFDVDWQRELEARKDRPIDVSPGYKPTIPQDVVAAEFSDQTMLDLSVEQAAMLALKNNRDLAVQQFIPTIVGAFEQIERGVYDPELFAQASYSEEKASETTAVTGQQFNVERQQTSASVGVRQQLPTGTTLEVVGSEDRSTSNRSPEQHAARLGLSVTQSLLRGFGPAVNLASIRQAEMDTLASVYELRGFTEALLAQTEIAYWNLALAQQQIVIFERSLELARQQLDEVEQRIEVGVIPRTEAAAARAEVALREQALINTRSELEAQRLRLLRLVNPGPSSQVFVREINTSSDPQITPEPIEDLNDRLLLSQRMRPDLNEAHLRLEQNRLQTIVTRNGMLPRLDLFVVLGTTGYAQSFSQAVSNNDGDTYDLTFGVNMNYNLGNRVAEARDQAARASRQQAAAAVENLRQIVSLDVRLAVNEVERARQQIDATAATLVLQEETLRAEQERFRVGSSTGLLVAQTQRDLLASQISQIEAIIGYRVALVNLYLAEGSLLERRGIRVEAAEPQR